MTADARTSGDRAPAVQLHASPNVADTRKFDSSLVVIGVFSAGLLRAQGA
jgi:hypothetical protein